MGDSWKTNKELEKLIGMNLSDARLFCEQKGYTTRVMREDDMNFFGTCDLRADRVNLELDNGVVTKKDVG
jgi:putative hemolysin